jgi:hypothetical protein
LLAEYSGSDLEYITERDAWECLCFAFGEYAGRFEICEALYETIGGKWDGFNLGKRKPEEVLIGKLSVCDGKCVDPTKKMNYSLEPVLQKNYDIRSWPEKSINFENLKQIFPANFP